MDRGQYLCLRDRTFLIQRGFGENTNLTQGGKYSLFAKWGRCARRLTTMKDARGYRRYGTLTEASLEWKTMLALLEGTWPSECTAMQKSH